MADAEQQPVKRRPGPKPKPSSAFAGTVSGYVNHGLRDPASRAAWARYMARRRRAS